MLTAALAWAGDPVSEPRSHPGRRARAGAPGRGVTPVAARRPDRQAALAQYRRRAPLYDVELLAFEPVRRQAIERLALAPGEPVVDVGAGTGLSLPALVEAVGANGRVIAVEPCPEM